MEWVLNTRSKMTPLFEDRHQAGEQLAEKLKSLSREDLNRALVIGLPRGGVPVAYVVAETLDLPLDVLIVRKLGHPLQPEYAIGAITEEGQFFMSQEAELEGVFSSMVEDITQTEKQEVDRRVQRYRAGKPLPELKEKTVIIIDDGLATGATMHAAVDFFKKKEARKIIVALPVGAQDSVNNLKQRVSEVICLHTPEEFWAVGNFYRNFNQVSDEEVVDFLSRARAFGPS